MTLEELAQEMNYVLGLDPRLDTSKSKRELKRKIEEVSKLLMESDDQPNRRDINNNIIPCFSQEAVDTLKEMNLWP